MVFWKCRIPHAGCAVATQVTVGFMWQGFGSRGASINFPRGAINLGSLQGQEPRGSWRLWPSQAESRNVEPLSCNSTPPHLHFLGRRKKRIYREIWVNLHFCNLQFLSPGFPSSSLRHLNCIKDFFPFPSLTFPFHFVAPFRPTN